MNYLVIYLVAGFIANFIWDFVVDMTKNKTARLSWRQRFFMLLLWPIYYGSFFYTLFKALNNDNDKD